MKKVLIIGTTGFSLVIANLIRAEKNAEIIGFCTRRIFIADANLGGANLYTFEDINDLFDKDKIYVLNTIGYSQMNGIREQMFHDSKEVGFKNYTFVSEKANVYSDNIGEGSIIMPGCYVGPYVKIGKSNIVYSNVTLTHHIEIGDYNFIGAGVTIGGDVIIKNNCFIGMNSTIRNGINLLSKTLIGMHSNILSSTEENKVYFGNPARLIRDNSINVKI